MSAPLTPGIGHNLSPTEKQKQFCEAITLWVGNQRLGEAMRREELGKLEGLQRALALRNGTIVNLILLCRLHPQESCRSAVHALITFMADNNEGICWLTVRRIAQLLSRARRSIKEAISVLEKDGLLGVKRANGLANSYWPLIPCGMATVGASVTWFADALSDRPVARVTITPDAECRGTPEAGFRGGLGGPLKRSAGTPEAAQHSISLKDISDEDNREGAATPDLKNEATTQKQDLPFPSVNLGNVDVVEAARRIWMRDPHGIAGGVNRAELERQVPALANILAANAQPDQVSEAIATATLEMSGRAFDKAAEKAGGSGAGFLKYFRSTVETCLERIIKRDKVRNADDAELAERTRVSSQIQAQRIDAFSNAVTDGAARRQSRHGARNGGQQVAGPSLSNHDRKTQAAALGVSESFLELFAEPLLTRFPNTKDTDGWRRQVGRLLAEFPNDALQFCASHIVAECKRPFMPSPAELRAGLHKYTSAKAQAASRKVLGEKVRKAWQVARPEWSKKIGMRNPSAGISAVHTEDNLFREWLTTQSAETVLS